MNPFEKILLALLSTAAKDAPIFIHSNQGMVILNASEDLLSNLLVAFQKSPPTPPPSA
jgi:hypothetical protein